MLTILDQVCSGGKVYWVLLWEGCPVLGPSNLSCTILPLYGSVDFQEPLGKTALSWVYASGSRRPHVTLFPLPGNRIHLGYYGTH